MAFGNDADGAWIAVRVPAKVNLFLAVRGRRPDGYHEVVTVMQTVSLYDRLRVSVVGPPGQGHHPATRRRMRVELGAAGSSDMPAPSENLAVVAARRLGESTGVIDVTVDGTGTGPRTIIELHKEIPVAAGMAGGSADAAGVLLALNELWGCELDDDELRRLADTLGSDVPFCVVGGTALATGRGTALARVMCRGTFHWVVCTAGKPLATPAVYDAWERHCRPSGVGPDAVLSALRGADAGALGAALHNELEPAAFRLRPELAGQRQALLDAGALGAVLSGSGPTLLALAADRQHAEALAAAVGERFAAAVVAHSPAGGPELELD